MDEGSSHDDAWQQQQQRRAEVLDSSDEESSAERSPSRTLRSAPSSSSQHQSHSPSPSAATMLTSNMNVGSIINSLASAATRAQNSGYSDSRIVGSVQQQQQQQQHVDEEFEYESDSGDELMNPYVMNPFPNRYNGNGNSRMLLDSAALLPPSMELAAISRTDDRSSSSSGINCVGGPAQRLLQPQLSQQNPTLQSQQQQKKQQQQFVGSPTRQKQSPLASFDPYSPKNSSGGVPVQQLRRDQTEQQQHQQQPGDPFYEMEMEEEESIEFLSPNRQRNIKSEMNNTRHLNGDSNLFGPLLDEPQSGRGYGGEEQPSFSSSFSPFPKHSPHEYANSTSGEYGESTPLSASGFAARHGRGASAAGSSRPAGGLVGILGALIDVLKAIISSAAYGASTLLYGNHQSSSPRGNSSLNNPFSSQRLNVRMSHHSNNHHWGRLSYFRLFAIAIGAFFCVGTVTTMWHVPNSSNDVGVTVMDKSAYQSQNGDDKTSIVLEKMGKAKRHWWNRKKSDSSSGANNVADGQPHTEIYRDGQKEVVQEIVHAVVQQQAVGSNISGSSVNASRETLPVIVQTEEDGTVLIKLPPPKMNVKQPKMGSVQPPPPVGDNLPEQPLGASSDVEETMYIKLPYPQQQQERRRTLTELDPPLRGAAIPQPGILGQSRNSKLNHYDPPPLAGSNASSSKHHQNDSNQHHLSGGFHSHHHEEHRGLLSELRSEFDSWVTRHGKKYGSKDEKEHRFNVWKKNHMRITEKNEKHGPCRMTGKAVFGHNLFSDLEPEEFQSKFLTGYHGPRAEHDHHKRKNNRKKNMDGHKQTYFREARRKTTGERPPPPASSVKRHPTIERKLEEHTAMFGAGSFSSENSNSRLNGAKYQASTYSVLGGCPWWDVSCMLRYVFGYQYIGGTREPLFDGSSYPSALDWREMGVVSEVHSQGSCGACWAITAVETIESANAIATGQLIDLAEEEVIACDGSCEMCNGGWPQNAYEYVMDHNGLPVKTGDYDADWLYTVTAVLAGESYEASEYEMGSYFSETCPAGAREGDGGGGSGSGSRDGGNYQYDSTYVEVARYGNVKGYGYATDRCICYTDGSGCDCDDQDEKTAVLNVASYGPAAVCLEASTWQDYEGGIMTNDIGCSKSFLDMNHCVEVVGYAFTDGSSNEDGNNESGSGSGSNDRNSGSNDQRDGYWIVKNQWSNYWGMNGYAYVAMGQNTCGILNDMTQVYME